MTKVELLPYDMLQNASNDWRNEKQVSRTVGKPYKTNPPQSDRKQTHAAGTWSANELVARSNWQACISPKKRFAGGLFMTSWKFAFAAVQKRARHHRTQAIGTLCFLAWWAWVLFLENQCSG